MLKEKIIVWGLGTYYKLKEDSIEKMFNVIGYIDNNKTNLKYLDRTVYTFKEYINLNIKDKILLMVSRNYIVEVIYDLIDNGIESKNIILPYGIGKSFDFIDDFFVKSDLELIIDKKIYLTNKKNRILINTTDDFISAIRELTVDKNIANIASLPLNPLSRRFGRERGTPIDRYYIEHFLQLNREYIKGKVAEVAENTYTMQYADGEVEPIVVHIDGKNGALKVNLATGEGVIENMADCFICTQTIQMIYEYDKVLKNIYKILRPNGVALITIHGISQLSLIDYNAWGEFWRVTPKCLYNMVKNINCDDFEIKSYGNVKTAIAFLYGMCQEDLLNSDFEYNDEQYPLVITCRISKK